jgi:transcriptional regulator with GAF, ATPase, and Fis domain
MIERTVFISPGGALDSPPASPCFTHREANNTEPEMHRRQRENLLAALRLTNWKIKRADGVTEHSGLKPTNLLTRMKKVGLKRPG